MASTKLLAKTLTTPPREDALRLFPISTSVVKKSSSRTLSTRCTTPRPVLEGTVRGQRPGATGATGSAPNSPEHAPTIPRCVPPTRFGNVHGLLYCPTANTPPVYGVVLLFPDSKHPSCVRDRAPSRLIECASVRCHSSGHYIMEPPHKLRHRL